MGEVEGSVRKRLDIPTREEHKRHIKKLWWTCIILATLVFLAAGGSFAGMMLAGTPAAVVVNISTGIFQIIVLSYGLGFFVPAFLTSLARLSLGIEMSRVGVEVGVETAEMLETTRKRADDLGETVKKHLEEAVRKGLEKFAEHAREMQDEIGQRIATEIDSALEEVFGENGASTEGPISPSEARVNEPDRALEEAP